MSGIENQIIIRLFGVYVLSTEIKSSINKTIYFTHHLNRCKKQSDIVRLTLLVVCEITYLSLCIPKLISQTEQLTDKIITPKRVGVKLLPQIADSNK